MKTMNETTQMAEAPSPYFNNKNFLLKLIMDRLDITEEDLHRDTDFIKNKVRQANLDQLLND